MERMPTPEEIVAAEKLRKAYKERGRAQDPLVIKASKKEIQNAMDNAVTVSLVSDMKKRVEIGPLHNN